MIRRKFMKYAPKEHSDEKVKKTLEKHNVPTFEGNQPAKFSQFGNVAKDLAAKSRKTFTTPDGGHVASAEKTFSWQQKAVYGGGSGPVPSQGDSRNPYAVSQPQGNPYASSPYGGGSERSGSNPYGSRSQPSNPYGGGGDAAGANPYGSTTTSMSTASTSKSAYPSMSPSRSEYSPAPSNRSARQESADPYGERPRGGSNPYGSADLGSYSNSGLRGSTPDRSMGDAYGAGGNYMAGSDNDFGGTPGNGSSTSLNDTMQGPSPYSSNFGTGSGATGAHEYDQYSAPRQQSFRSRQAAPSLYGEPLQRTQTNQSTSTTTAARQELFGSAPRRVNPDAAEFDELNRTHTELEEDDELLQTAHNLERPQFMAPPTALPTAVEEDELEPEDELNQLPSEFKRPADMGYEGNAGDIHGGGGNEYRSGQQLFEDSEDEDVDYVKREIRQTKQESVESTRRALQIAAEAENSGRNAMGMLGDQGERLGNSAKTVALGHVQARVGERNADELQRLNRSIFIPNVSNPFNSRRRNQLREQRLKSEREFDQLEREALDQQQRESEQRIADGLNGAGYGYSETALRIKQRMNRDNPERKMYQFEADSDDDALEDELDQNLDGISDAAKRLHNLSLKINDEVSDQNARIELMGGRVDELDYRLHKSTAKMATIN